MRRHDGPLLRTEPPTLAGIQFPFLSLPMCDAPPFGVSMKGPLPIFIISYNRGAFLEQVINSYNQLDWPVQIIIHDNGSDDSDTLRSLDRLEANDCIVYRRQKIKKPDDLNNTNETIQEFFRDCAGSSRYAVTDCDIDLSIAKPNVLELYDELLDLFPAIQCVGPMLRIRDISDGYPLFNSVMTRHIEQFWRKMPDWIETKYGRVATIACHIDTSFALHRAGDPFFKQKIARRVYHPYEAQHLDWYYGPISYCRSPYFHTSSGAISHWNNKQTHERFAKEDMRFDHFIYVDEDDSGRLVEKTHYVTRVAT